MNDRGMDETTFSLIQRTGAKTVADRRHLQIGSILLLDLLIGLYVGDFAGRAVGHHWPCIALGAALGLVLGLASVRTIVRAAVTGSVTVDATHLRLVRRNQNKPAVAVPLEAVRSIEDKQLSKNVLRLWMWKKGMLKGQRCTRCFCASYRSEELRMQVRRL